MMINSVASNEVRNRGSKGAVVLADFEKKWDEKMSKVLFLRV